MTPQQLEQFWHDNDLGLRDPFSPEIPRVPVGIHFGFDAIFDELGLPSDLQRLEHDYAYACQLADAFNQRALAAVGRPLISAAGFDPERRFPHVKGVGELFGCARIWQSESWWLVESAHTPAELARVLDRVERMDLREQMFPPDWDRRCNEIYQRTGLRPVLGHGLRGPVTLATSIFGVEPLLYLLMDDPALAQRFRDVLMQTILRYYEICDEVSDPARRSRGFRFFDDNSALLTPDLYEFFGLPILKAVFDRFAPEPGDLRYQHSDSDMGHLLDLLAQAGLNAVNFGPNLTVSQIRKAMPRAVIHGQLAPLVFMRNDEPEIVAQVRRDCDQARHQRGLVLSTAGSVNNGTRLTSLRRVIETLDQYGNYPRVRPAVPARSTQSTAPQPIGRTL